MADDGMPSSSLVEVEFGFTASGVNATFRVVSLHLTEAISEPFSGAIEIATETDALQGENLLGKTAALTIDRGELQRTIHGLIASVEDRGTTADHRVFEVVLVPQLWLLSQRSAHRIFQDLHAVAIVKDVLREAGVYTSGPGIIERVPDPKPREYCVQYGETDLEFVRRLLDEEGFAYAFEHTADGEGLILFDPGNADALHKVESTEGTLAVMGNGLATHDAEGLAHLDAAREVVPTALSLRDWDFTHSNAVLSQRSAAPNDRGLAVQDHPARFTLGPYDAGGHTYGAPDMARHGRLRLQAAGQRARTVRVGGNVTGFTAGRMFMTREEGPRALHGRHLLTRVVHIGNCPEVLYAAATGGQKLDRYSNQSECAPLGEGYIWRPAPVSPRPRVDGPQTAVVMAEPGSSDEIVTDHHGRVLVRFHWDAIRSAAQQSKRSSCWLRVAQNWAGANWGFLFVPRVGMEVIVQFLDGDPDRPIVTGCVYNGTHPTPVKLPEKKTQSGIRTQSSPHNGGYNELRFEDAAGDEHVWFRAQKDHTEHVLHDRKTDVDHDQTVTIKHDESHTVVNNRSITVKANETHEVKKNRQTAVKGHEQREVTGNDSLIVHKTRTTHVDQDWKLTADEGASIEVGSSAKLDMKPDEILMEAPSGITIKCGDNKIEMTPAGITLSTSAGAKVALQGPMINIEGGANVTVKAGAMMTISGVLVKIN